MGEMWGFDDESFFASPWSVNAPISESSLSIGALLGRARDVCTVPKIAPQPLSTISLQPPSIASALASPPSDDGENVTIQVFGTVRTIRKQKQRAFLQLGDGSTVHHLQALLNPDHAQGYDSQNRLKNYPIQKKFQTAEFLRSIPHLRLRLPLHALLARIRSESEFLLAQYFRDRSFLRVQSPVITSSDCEGAGQVFSLDTRAPVPEDHGDAAPEGHPFFRKPKYLTVSSQLHLEAYMQEHPKVWTFSPTFRAEKSDTPRHVSEFWMLEVEMRTQSLQEIMNLVEDMIKSLVQGLQQSSFMDELITMRRSRENLQTEEYLEDLEPLPTRWAMLKEGPWPQITYTEALRLLQDSAVSGKSKFLHEPSWESGLQFEHEKYIAATVGAGKPVFVTHYPQIIKPFYMLPSATKENDSTVAPRTSACFDLLLPEVCEAVGGSLREHRLEELEATMPLLEPSLKGKSPSERTEVE
ncbi:MAG: hypothetical protein L6R36_004166 [Xanthoria steineri]|nr:MAG: hypothetical protein L6R36_004166 [Xanthoria steineri]